MTQDDILKLMYQKEELTTKEIIQELNLAKNTVSAQLGRLRKKKLIKFKKDKNQLKIIKVNNYRIHTTIKIIIGVTEC